MLPNPKIGIIHIETYLNNDQLAKVYAIGIYSYIDDEPKTFYISKEDLNSDIIVINCINEMLKTKYEGITLFAHNFGKFDSIFIIKIILEYYNNLP